MPSLRFYTIVGILLVPATTGRVETLRSVSALPAPLAASFRQPDGFVALGDGRYVVADRRGHTVYVVPRDMSSAQPVIRIGEEPGNILRPFGFDVDAEAGLILVGDSPGPRDRIQVFTMAGSRVAGFSLPARAGPGIRMDGFVVNGVTALRATPAHTVLVNRPDTGALITEYDYYGRLVGSVGRLRAAGQNDDAALQLAMNTGLALPVSSGGYYFVFQSGEPRFRRFDGSGRLQYERAIQGPELDTLLQSQPTTWPHETGADGERVPLVSSIVRAATVDAHDRLWVSLAVPYTYVYEADGEKVRTVEFRAAGTLQPSSLSFGPDGRLFATPGCYIFQP